MSGFVGGTLKLEVKVTSRIYIADRKTFVFSAQLNQFTRRDVPATHLSSLESGNGLSWPRQREYYAVSQPRPRADPR